MGTDESAVNEPVDLPPSSARCTPRISARFPDSRVALIQGFPRQEQILGVPEGTVSGHFRDNKDILTEMAGRAVETVADELFFG